MQRPFLQVNCVALHVLLAVKTKGREEISLQNTLSYVTNLRQESLKQNVPNYEAKLKHMYIYASCQEISFSPKFAR